MQERIRKAEEGTEIRELTVTALLTALTYLFTAFVNVLSLIHILGKAGEWCLKK